MASTEKMRLAVPGSREVSALLARPPNARGLLVLGHGAGAGMAHPFLAKLAADLAGVGMATLRYQFPYIEERRRVPDKPELLIATVDAAVRKAIEVAPRLPLLAGGKSMGGRMTSQAAAQGLLAGVKGLVFFGFPLHPPNRPGTKRADHLAKVSLPMLFLQGTRDTLADLALLGPLCEKLGTRATLHIIPEADHSFHVLKKAGKTDVEVMKELAQTTAAWADKLND
ncbi:MAG: alpha/beta hydrolase [Acidobacteria bacterium]|nr:MAG: alpha/beta hydrolase [Acidobacteriota bacterium]